MAVYKGLEATLHEAFWGDRGSDIEVAEILRLFPEFSGRALEVGAGSGRIVRPLYEAGWQIEGIEPSEEMVEMYKTKCPFHESAPIDEVSLEEFETDKKYDLILLTAYVFQLFGCPQEVFEKVDSLLAEGGIVYFSTFIPWSEIVAEIPEDQWTLDDEIKLPSRRKARAWVNFEIDRVRQKLTRKHRYEVLEVKKVVEMTKTEQVLRYYTLPEMELLLEKYGYALQGVSYDFSDKYNDTAHSLSYTFTKG